MKDTLEFFTKVGAGPKISDAAIIYYLGFGAGFFIGYIVGIWVTSI